ncbi:MAG: hypothetical protein IKK57_07460 [Clostridia bacterium]|nr:hypothetical protein [Clostridia bacterium]
MEWVTQFEEFGACLQRILQEEGLTASAVARMVGFRSRNSLFRILNGETSAQVEDRFLSALHGVMKDQWPQEHWHSLETALDIKRVGLRQHLSNRAFCHGIGMTESTKQYVAEMAVDGAPQERPLRELLEKLCRSGEVSVVICGCCERSLTACLDACLNPAGAEGRLKVRHYIDVSENEMVRSILGVLPLLSRVWYNARLVDEAHCPPQMMALYRLNAIAVNVKDGDGAESYHQLILCADDRFVYTRSGGQEGALADVMDRRRFQLELLKPLTGASEGAQAFVEYTQRYAELERDCMILSVKPDIHFNLVPCEVLYPAILEGFDQSGMTGGEGLQELMQKLWQIHEGRVRNMYGKRRPTHIVYSVRAMEQFMRTGVQTDHFFIQRAYTVEERRKIIRQLLRQVQEEPYFHVYFMKPELPDIRTEMTLYDKKGVLLMDAYSSYDLHDDHSEAVITIPGFMASFQRFFMDVLLERLTISREASAAQLERLLQMEVE